MHRLKPASRIFDLFPGDGEIASLMREKDWTATSLGPPEQWPEALKTAVRILLTSRFDMWLGWGDDVSFLYNDAYRPTLGAKHPASLARPTEEIWAEIWPDVE
ncbi:MAG: hybrid sensor histidine kinase/response regulator, partial [Rhizobiaceae bacterium]